MKKFLPLAILIFVAQLSCGNSSAFAAPTLTAETNRPRTSTLPLGENVEITFKATGLSKEAENKLTLQVVNEFGNTLDEEKSIDISVNDDGEATHTFSAPSDKLGYYEVRARLADGTTIKGEGTRPDGLISYAIVPDPLKRLDYGDELSRFGVQGGYNVSALVIPYLGVRYLFSGNDWGQMEPDRASQFIQTRYKADREGKRYPPKSPEYDNPIFNNRVWRTYHMSLITKASMPSWALKAGTEGTSCTKFGELNEVGEKALPEFALAQAKAFAEDYKYQTKRYYQVTWEPASGWCYRGTAAGLVKIFEKSYDAIHQGDRTAVVVGPTLHVDHLEAAQLKALLKEGLGKYVDALSFHPKQPWPAEKNGMPQIIRELREEAAKTMKKPVRFLGTEQGLSSIAVGPLNKALGDIRVSLMMLGEGADFDIGFYIADFWDKGDLSTNKGYGYYWNLNPKKNSGTDKLGPKPIVPAYAAMTYFLDGTKSEGVLKNISGTQLGYRFKKTGMVIDVVWDYDKESPYPVPDGAQICDWMGNCSTSSQKVVTVKGNPTYFISGKFF